MPRRVACSARLCHGAISLQHQLTVVQLTMYALQTEVGRTVQIAEGRGEGWHDGGRCKRFGQKWDGAGESRDLSRMDGHGPWSRAMVIRHDHEQSSCNKVTRHCHAPLPRAMVSLTRLSSYFSLNLQLLVFDMVLHTT